MKSVRAWRRYPLTSWCFWYLQMCRYSENTSLVRENGPGQDTTWSSDGPGCVTLQLDHFISAVNSSQHTQRWNTWVIWISNESPSASAYPRSLYLNTHTDTPTHLNSYRDGITGAGILHYGGDKGGHRETYGPGGVALQFDDLIGTVTP